MWQKTGGYVAFATAVAGLLLASPGYARHELPMLGGRGDAGAQAQCPPGQALVGFSGRAGLWIDAIQMVCAGPGAQPVAMGGRYGGPNGGAQDRFCPRNSMMGSATLNMTTGNRQVAAINFECRSRATGETTPASFGNPNYHARCPGFGVGDCAMDSNMFQTCPADEVPIGFNVRYGQHVNAIGLICGRI